MSFINFILNYKKRHEIHFEIPITIEQDTDNSFYAYSSILKGVHVSGDTKEEAINNIKTACSLYIQSLIKHGDSIPLQIVKNKENKRINYTSFSENIMIHV